MNQIRLLFAIPLALLALAGPAHALEYVYPDGTVTNRPLANPPPYAYAGISDSVRNTDLRLGDCLKANGGRMVPRCAALLDRSNQLAGTFPYRVAGDFSPRDPSYPSYPSYPRYDSEAGVNR